MNIQFFDVHSHLNLSPLWEKREDVVKQMRDSSVATIAVGTDLEISQRAILLAEEFPDVVLGATVGLHPNDNEAEVFDPEKYKKLLIHSSVVAIGECGLDYFRNQDETMKQKQKEVFQQHIVLAQEFKKPLMIHARPSKGSMDAYIDVLSILESFPEIKVNFHFFVGNVEVAKKVLARGGTMSFDGPITFSSEYDEVIKYIPLESIMAETDAPFAAPAPYRGRENSPAYVGEVYKAIARIKNLDLEVVRVALIANARKAFDIRL